MKACMRCIASAPPPLPYATGAAVDGASMLPAPDVRATDVLASALASGVGGGGVGAASPCCWGEGTTGDCEVDGAV